MKLDQSTEDYERGAAQMHFQGCKSDSAAN
jgi:hypothetical protein